MRSRTFLSLCSAAATLFVFGAMAACGGDVVGMPILPGSDALTTDSGSTPDAGTGEDASTSQDAGGTNDAKLPDGEFVAEVTVDVLGQNCMPAVMPDPVTAQGRFKITNQGKTAIGPVTIVSAAFLDPTSKAIVALFTATSSAPTIAPGTSSETTFSKVSGSMSPANGCATLKCNDSYLVALELSGPGIPKSTTATSAPKVVGCVF